MSDICKLQLVVSMWFVAAWSTGQAADYYSGAGSDTLGNGSLSSPWQTITKLNTLNLNAGDNVYFRSGDTFAGNVVLDANDSANNPFGVYGGLPVTISSYGVGNRPVISSSTEHGFRSAYACNYATIGAVAPR
jgi:hypothetical protein